MYACPSGTASWEEGKAMPPRLERLATPQILMQAEFQLGPNGPHDRPNRPSPLVGI